MKLGVLFSGGKDSVYSAWIAKREGYDLTCLISIFSNNQESYMFHTPSIRKVEKQANVMGVPLMVVKTEGEKEKELDDLMKGLKRAKMEFGIEGVVTGAVESVYQATRIQKICDDLGLEVFNPLWQRDQFELLNDLLRENFKVIVSGVFAFPLDNEWIGREINNEFVKEMGKLNKKWKINPAGEGGEYESFVLECPLFKRKLKVKGIEVKKEGENAFRGEVVL